MATTEHLFASTPAALRFVPPEEKSAWLLSAKNKTTWKLYGRGREHGILFFYFSFKFSSTSFFFFHLILDPTVFFLLFQPTKSRSRSLSLSRTDIIITQAPTPNFSISPTYHATTRGGEKTAHDVVREHCKH